MSAPNRPPLDRRDWLAQGAAAVGALVAPGGRSAAGPGGEELAPAEARRAFLRRLLYDRADLDAWLAGKAFPFSKYDPELGYLHIDRDFKEGEDGSVCRYRYDPSGARHVVSYAGQPCRVNTYGDSFTSCEQVSDGETWQEVLAGHIGEPVRNFGIGGYSVYQAYLRMRREEGRSPAAYIILNIFDDDHYRNLLPWQRVRFGMNRKSTNPPVPYVRVDPDAGTFEPRANPCPTAASLYDLCDLEQAERRFADDYFINHYVRREQRRKAGAKGVPATDFDDPELTRRALYASMRVVELVEAFAARERRKVLYVLSYNPRTVRRRLKGEPRFDQPFVDFLRQRRLPFVDLLEAHAADYAKWKPDVEGYVGRYFIGHYNPLGNFFCAFAMKDRVVGMLQRRPPAYRKDVASF